MPRVNLLGGTYLARSLTADAQRCSNLYPERNPQDASAPYTNQLTPGLIFRRAPNTAGVARGMYTATNGSLYYVCGLAVYFVDPNFNITQLGTLSASVSAGLTTPVGMQDNGNVLVIVDGSTAGYAINLQTGIAGRPLTGQRTNAGTGGTAGTYTNEPLTGGSGSGATATFTVANGSVTDFSLDDTGNGYVVGDTLAFNIAGLSSTAFKLTGVGAQVNAFAQIVDPNFLGSVAAGYVDTFLGFNQPDTRNFYTSLSNITFQELTGTPGQPSIGTIIAAGSGGTNGTYNNVPLTGGSGDGNAAANITVASGIISVLGAITAGSGGTSGSYNNVPLTGGSGTGALANITIGSNGLIATFGSITAGTGGTNGTYNNVPLTGGSGTGATANITVSGGHVTAVTLVAAGINYNVGDTLSAATSNIGSVTGFSIPVATISGGGVTACTLVSGGENYATSDSLGASSGTIGGTSGFSISVSTIINGGVTSVVLLPTGLGYNAGDDLGANNVNVPSTFQYSLDAVAPPAFDPTYIVGKTGYPDLLATIVAVHREWWLMGAYESAEVWYDSGGANFPFAIMPGVFIQHGCYAPYSVVTHDLVVFWLGIDSAGIGTVYLGAGYAAKRISTYSVEKILGTALAAGYTLTDAIGMVYKQQDHVFYVLTFPSANITLVYDLTEGLWHDRTWTDPNTGQQNRIRANCMALAYGLNVCGDWQNGNIYVLDLNTYTDNGNPIVRRRGLPHMLAAGGYGKRVSYDSFLLDMDCGNGVPSDPTYKTQVTLEYSDDRGRTWYRAPTQSMGAQGEYLVQMQWRRLGLARDRVFRVTWSEAAFTAINGAWVDITPAET